MTIFHLRVARSWRIFTYVLCILLGGVALFGIFLYSFSEADEAQRLYWFIVPLLAVILLFSLYGIIETIRHKVIIDDKSIQLISTFYRRELSFDQIRGYSIDKYHLILWPHMEELSEIKISKFIENYVTVRDLIIQRVHYLHTPNTAKRSFSSTEDYAQTAAKAKLMVRILTAISIVVCIWVYFWPLFYRLAVSVTTLLPLISLFILGRFKGLVTFNEEKNQTQPSVLISVAIPITTLVLVALRDVKIFSFQEFFIFGGITAVCMLILTLASTNEFRVSKVGSWLVVSLAIGLFFVYGMASSVLFNSVWDTSTPVYYSVKVLGKSVSHGKSTTYYLDLDAWGPVGKQQRESVSHSFYDKTHIGDTVRLQLKQGKLHIPWYSID